MGLRVVSYAALLLAALLVAPPARSQALSISLEEFRLWREYQAALEDPRVRKLPQKSRLPAIARNFQVSEKALRAAVAKGEEQGAGVAAQQEQAIRAALATTELASRLRSVKVDASAAHVVTYLVWTADQREATAVDREVCLAAARASAASALTSTFKFEVTDPLDGQTKLFEALIGRGAAARIRESNIVDFASTRYLKLFEKVSRVEL